MIQSMALGVKALNFSANVFEEDASAGKEKVKAAEIGNRNGFSRRHDG